MNDVEIPFIPEDTKQYDRQLRYDEIPTKEDIKRAIETDQLPDKIHATPKPIELCTRAIPSSSRQGENVLDIFGGSGSTLIACEQLGRNCYTIELDPKYVDVIINRWETLTGKTAVKIVEGIESEVEK